jgi:hypothetical protein
MHLRSLVNSLTCPQLFVILIKIMLAGKRRLRYQLYDCDYFFEKPRFEKRCLFSDSLLDYIVDGVVKNILILFTFLFDNIKNFLKRLRNITAKMLCKIHLAAPFQFFPGCCGHN